jgi:tRNA dimethylallyltransferase
MQENRPGCRISFPGAKKIRILQIVKRLIVLGGATASGKTAMALHLARHFRTEILSADSRQFYKGMAIGTAQPEKMALSSIKHHFIDFLEIQSPYSVGDFERDALLLLEKLFLTHDDVIITGGSGLFLKAVCEGLDVFPEVSPEIRLQVALGEQEGGLAWLQDQLRKQDPVYFEKVDQRNPARLRRALEVSWSAGSPYSSFLSHSKTPRFFESVYILLDLPRAALYTRIDERVDQMLAAGLEQEVRGLLPFRHLNPLKTVGYEEFFDYFDGLLTYEQAVEKIKQHTRNYAKRQATWFRKQADWAVFHPDDVEGILGYLARGDGDFFKNLPDGPT